MSKNRVLSYMLCVSILTVHSVSHAKEDTTMHRDMPVTLDKAIDVALHNRLEVVLASKQKAGAAIRVKLAKGDFFPRIDVSGTSSYIHSFDKFSGINADVNLGTQNYHVSVEKTQPEYELRTSLDLNYNIFSGGMSIAALEEKIAEEAALQHEESAIKTKVSMEVMNAYWALRKSQINTRIAERAYLHAKKQLLIAETRKASGLISSIDVEAEVLSVSEARFAVVNAAYNEAGNSEKYRESLGLQNSGLQPTKTRMVSLIDDPERVRYPDLAVVADRPETLKLKSELMASEARVRKAKASYLPQIDFFTSYKMVGRDADDYVNSNRLRSDYVTVGLKASFNIFNGFMDKERIALAKSEETIARLRVEQNIRQLDAQMRGQVSELETLKKEVTLSEQRVKIQASKKRLAEEKYRNREISEIELNKAARNYDDFADKLLLAKIDVAVAQLSLYINNKTN